MRGRKKRTVLLEDSRVRPLFVVDRSIMKDFEGVPQANSIIIYYTLNMLADNETRMASPTAEEIAKYSRCSERTVWRGLKDLEESGYIKIINERDSDGRQMNNKYVLLDKPLNDGGSQE